MASVEPLRKRPREPVPLQDHALDNLRYIRETMERAGSFTAVPGWGGVAMGATALAAAGIASHAPSRLIWMVCWLVEGLVAMAVVHFDGSQSSGGGNAALVGASAQVSL